MTQFRSLRSLRSLGSVVSISALALFAAGCAPDDPEEIDGAEQELTTIANLIPQPVSVTSTGSSFTLDATTGAAIYVDAGSPELASTGAYLQGKLQPSTGYALAVTPVTTPPTSGIYLTTVGGDPTLGTEGYLLTVTGSLVTLSAYTPAGVFRGVQTIRQMLPAAIEKSTLQAGPWTMSTGTVRDYPRWAWRGSMLDVVRHFFSVAVVERYIDQMAYFKMNTLHLHLGDDQGWRVQITGWPNLTGNTAANGSYNEVGSTSCTNCFYTQADYAALVAYAKARYITIIPEFDGPGHINAALHSYGSLTCSGVAPAAYTGTGGPTTSLCTSVPSTYIPFLTAVITQISALSDGTFFHMGGDEALSTPLAEYITYEQNVKAIVEAATNVNGAPMRLLGWEEIAQGSLSPTSAVQHWNTGAGFAADAVAEGATVVMSPANHCYLDQRYNSNKKSPGHQTWAGYVNTQTAYSWDPNAIVTGVSGASVDGVEAPLFTEYVPDTATMDSLAYPRLTGHAEIGWSATSGTAVWTNYATRLGSFGSRYTAMGIQYYADPNVGITWH
jgi:hexosaminidase